MTDLTQPARNPGPAQTPDTQGPGRPKTALLVRGGWDGHSPIEATDKFAAELDERGYRITTSETLDSYLDADLLAETDLIVQCWTMGTITAEQVAGLSAAVRAGTGLAGWHGGIADSFRNEVRYQLITGGQFIHHPREFVDYRVRVAPGRQAHPLVAGIPTFAVHTEQYYLHVDPTVDVLAVTDYVVDPQYPEFAGRVMPVVWTKRWGAGRVFVTTVGHKLDDLDVPENHEIIMRGLIWATR